MIDSIIKASSSFYWLTRLLNNNSLIKDYVHKKCEIMSDEMYIIQASTTFPLYELLSISSYHITTYLGVAYEASVFGMRTMICGEGDKDLYSNEIENKVFDYYYDDGGDVSKLLYLISNKNNYYTCDNGYINCNKDTFEKKKFWRSYEKLYK